MEILINSAGGAGYTIEFLADDGTRKAFDERISNMHDALDYAYALATEVERSTGQHIEPLISAAAIRDNRHGDIAARKLWKNPDFRVVK